MFPVLHVVFLPLHLYLSKLLFLFLSLFISLFLYTIFTYLYIVHSNCNSNPRPLPLPLLHSIFLDGLPGPYIKWFLESLGNQGLVNLLAAYPDKSAYAMCQVAFSPGPSFEPVVFGGNVYGTIVQPQPNLGKSFFVFFSSSVTLFSCFPSFLSFFSFLFFS